MKRPVDIKVIKAIVICPAKGIITPLFCGTGFKHKLLHPHPNQIKSPLVKRTEKLQEQKEKLT